MDTKTKITKKAVKRIWHHLSRAANGLLDAHGAMNALAKDQAAVAVIETWRSVDGTVTGKSLVAGFYPQAQLYERLREEICRLGQQLFGYYLTMREFGLDEDED